jgi:hypothetical protein
MLMSRLHLATFRVDVTVPLGHPLCGGWIKPAERIGDPLYALGVVLLGGEAPVVLCAVDWTGILNEAHRHWRKQLAAAAHTTPERVAVQTVHQHNAPFADLTAQKLVSEQKKLPSVMQLPWFEETVDRVGKAVRESLSRTQQVTDISWGQAKVDMVASNRRLIGPDGKIAGWRASACKDAKLRAEPEGLIDPWLKTVVFWSGQRKLTVLHYYATHPMSRYGDGIVTSDFVGHAREQRTKEDGVPHIYFTGCAGNIAAGKYNDGSKDNRPKLSLRVLEAMRGSEKNMRKEVASDGSWRVRPVVLPPRTDVSEAALLADLQDEKQTVSIRIRAAMKLAYRRRALESFPIQLTSLQVGQSLCLLHLPGESFVEYQLFAQEQRPQGFVCTAAYGDDGPWYIPLAKSYAEGGYEPSASFIDPAEELLKEEIKRLMVM